MKAILAFFLVLIGARAWATNYYLSANGNDSNSGLSTSTPWLTPNHPLSCGDTIQAAASANYNYANFQAFGPVTCAVANVAWLQCITFDACKITVPSQGGSTGYNYAATGLTITNSYWGLSGWEVSNPTTASNTQGCINLASGLHHIVIADNVANVCGASGISASADYVAVIGNVVYAAATSNTDCHSGIDAFRPVQFDKGNDTHIYIAGNFVWGTINPSGCYDGNGIISDTLDHYNSDCSPFTGRVLIDDNISIGNGGVGVRIEYSGPQDFPSNACPQTPSQFASQLASNNTTWGNGGCNGGTYGFGSQTGGELQVQKAVGAAYVGNLAYASNEYLCGDSYPESDGTYAINAAIQVADGDNSDIVKANLLFSPFGHAVLFTDLQGKPISNPSQMNLYEGSNTLQPDPHFRSAMVPGIPHCDSYANVPSCMGVVIANFTPQASGSGNYGYYSPTSGSANTLYPRWLCNVTLPPGLVAPYC